MVALCTCSAPPDWISPVKTLPLPRHGLPSSQHRPLVVSFLVLFTGLASLLTPMTSHAIEEPAYAVIEKLQDIEIREYAPFTVAEVVVAGDQSTAGNAAFPILAGYIFGKNKGERKLDMTAPVTQTPLEPGPPVKLEMIAPVTQAPAPGGFAVQFVMPKGYTLATLPEPVDAKVKLREVSGQRVAVIRFSGGWSQSAYEAQLQALRAALATAGIQTQGEPVSSRYNSPFSLPFLRRNEVWLNLV